MGKKEKKDKKDKKEKKPKKDKKEKKEKVEQSEKPEKPEEGKKSQIFSSTIMNENCLIIVIIFNLGVQTESISGSD